MHNWLRFRTEIGAGELKHAFFKCLIITLLSRNLEIYEAAMFKPFQYEGKQIYRYIKFERGVLIVSKFSLIFNIL